MGLATGCSFAVSRKRGIKVNLDRAGQRLHPRHQADIQGLHMRGMRHHVTGQEAEKLPKHRVVLASGARLACDVPLLVLSQSTPAWLQDTGLADSAESSLALGQHLLIDAHQRSTSHPEVFFVQEDSLVLSGNLRAVMNAEPSQLRAVKQPAAQFLYAGSDHALAVWRGHCFQGRIAGWLKQLANA